MESYEDISNGKTGLITALPGGKKIITQDEYEGL